MEILDEKLYRKLELQSKESNCLKVIGFILLPIAIAALYCSNHKSIEVLRDITLEMIAINVAILTLNMSLYINVSEKINKAIDQLRSEEPKYKEEELLYQIAGKQNNYTLCQMIISGFYTIISSVVILLLNLPILVKNMITIGAFTSVLAFLLQLIFYIRSFNMIRITKEKK